MAAKKKPALLIVAAFAAIYILWGSTYLSVAVALQSMPPFLLMATRSLVGGSILLACACVTGGSTLSPREWALAGVCGVLFFVGCHGILAYAQQRVSSGLAAVLLATIPFWIALLTATLPGNDRLSKQSLAFLIPGFAGVGLIAWREVNSAGSHGSDIMLLLGASASWAIGTIVSKRRADPVSPLAFSGMQLLAGGLVLLIISIALGEPLSFDLSKISIPSVAAWIYLTIAGTVIAFVAYTWLLKRVAATMVATYTFVNPIIAVLLGWAFLGERPTPWMIAGASLVMISVGGLLIAQRKSTKKETESQAKQARVRR
jgi:drug/metabolite transporter (DMT)-like permease